MSTAFADSSFYVALLISRDANHTKAMSVAKTWHGQIVTTQDVLTEVANHLCGSSLGRAKFGMFLASLEADPNTTIVESSTDLWKRGVGLYLNRTDKQWSLTDCISFLVMEERDLNETLTTDHHFEQAGFTVLLT
jgi:predicted nucleic acid-binding protein